MSTFTCDHCGGEFTQVEGWDPYVEAEATFRPDELEGAAVVCDDCWQAMRDAMPHFDARYAEQGL